MKGPYIIPKRTKWYIKSWKEYKISQQPVYEDLVALELIKSKVNIII